MKIVSFRTQGFTFIEVVIVMGVIAILAALAWPNFIAARERGKDEAARAFGAEVALAVATYQSRQVRSVSTVSTALSPLGASNGSAPNGTSLTGGYDCAKAFSLGNRLAWPSPPNYIRCSVLPPSGELDTTFRVLSWAEGRSTVYVNGR